MKRAIIIAAAAIFVASTIWSGAQMFAQLFGATVTPIPAVAWYKLDGNALDSSGNGYHGTWTGTEAYTNGPYSGTQAGSFDGSSYITPYSSLGLPSPLTQLTFSVWVMREGENTTGNIMSIGTNGGTGAGSTNGVTIYNRSAVKRLAIYSPSWFTSNITYDSLLNVWTYMTLVVDGSVRKMYINSQLVSQWEDTPQIILDRNFVIGGYHRNLPSDYRAFWIGKIDDVRIYDCALSEDNIKRIMESQDNEPLEELQ